MRIMRCVKCNRYTLLERCGQCGATAISCHPPKFSPEKEEKWGKYRRMGKE